MQCRGTNNEKTVSDSDIGEATAGLECRGSNDSGIATDRNVGKTDARLEGAIANCDDTVPHVEALKAVTRLESRISDVGDATGDSYDIYDPSLEGGVPDAGNWIAVSGTRNNHYPTTTSVSCDGDCPIVGRESELGLRHGWQGEQQQERQPFEKRFLCKHMQHLP
ncbi:MAG: hypothetical protein WCK27_08990 [Verrucomicrobiota bacterium]